MQFFSNLPKKAFYCLNGIDVPLLVLKVMGYILRHMAKRMGLQFCFAIGLKISACPMVHGEPWDLQEIGSMVKWCCWGLQGVKIPFSVAPFSLLFSAVYSPENKTTNDLQSIQ